MFDGFLMSITNKLKKISASLDLYEGKFDEISTDVGTVNTAVSDIETKVDTVQTTSDEIKALIGTEVATQLSTLESNILAAMPSSSSGITSCIRKIQRGYDSYNHMSSGDTKEITLSGFSNLNKMVAIVDGWLVKSLTNTKLTIVYADSNTCSGEMYYQVIEFY